MTPEAARQIADCVRHDWERVMGIKPGMDEAARSKAIAEAAQFYSAAIKPFWERTAEAPIVPTASIKETAEPSTISGKVIEFPVQKQAAG